MNNSSQSITVTSNSVFRHMDIISFFLIPPLLVIAAVITNEFVNMVTKELADKCSALAGEISELRARVEELARSVSESSTLTVHHNLEPQEEKTQEEKPREVQQSHDIANISRNHSFSDIELACEIVRKDLKDIPDREKRYAGYVFTDLEDTYFFDQLMAQNQDLKETIETSMRKFMSDNLKLEPARRFYVPKSTFEKYMRTNEY